MPAETRALPAQSATASPDRASERGAGTSTHVLDMTVGLVTRRCVRYPRAMLRPARSAGRSLARMRVAATMATAYLVLSAFGGPAFADDPPTDAATAADPAARERARKLFEDGVKQFKQKKTDAALASFRAAWALTKHFQIAAYLGECEIALGRHRDAAEHLTYALEEPADQTPPEQRARLTSMLEGARAKVARLTITVDADGATVLVGGNPIGSSPLPKAIFVEPGSVTVQAVHDGEGFTAARWSRDVVAGADEAVTLSVRVSPRAAGSGASAAGDAASPPAPAGGSSRSVLPLIVGSAVAAVTAGVGVGLTVAAIGKGDDVDRQDAELVKKNLHCAAGSTATECRAIFDTASARDTFTVAAIACYAGAAVAAAGGVVWYVMQPRRPADAASAARPQVTAVPLPRGASVGVAGRF